MTYPLEITTFRKEIVHGEEEYRKFICKGQVSCSAFEKMKNLWRYLYHVDARLQQIVLVYQRKESCSTSHIMVDVSTEMKEREVVQVILNKIWVTAEGRIAREFCPNLTEYRLEKIVVR